MACKYINLSDEKRLAFCTECETYQCVELKDEHASCPVCQNTGAADIQGDEVVICRKCLWGKWLEIEQHEYRNLKDIDFFR